MSKALIKEPITNLSEITKAAVNATPAKMVGEPGQGPWAVDDHLPPNGRDVIARVGNIAISSSHIGPDDNHDLANAKLIAAAPDLAEALKAVLERCGRKNIEYSALKMIDAALAKAGY